MTDSYSYKVDAFTATSAIEALTALSLVGATAVTHF